MSTRRCLFFLSVLLLLAMTACGGGSGSKLNLSSKADGKGLTPVTLEDMTRQLGVEAPTTDGGGLPSVPVDTLEQSGRGVSSAGGSTEGGDLVVYGRDFWEAKKGKLMDGNLQLESGDGPGMENMDWALYRVPGMYRAHPEKVKLDAQACNSGECYFIGVADYSTMTWKWYGPATNNEGCYEFDLSQCKQRMTSRGGCFYYVLCTPRKHKACHKKTWVTPKHCNNDDCGCKPGCPLNVTASKGTFDTGIEVSWDAADGATDYDLVRDEVSSTPQHATSASECDPDLTVNFHCDTVSVECDKDISNVVVQFTDGVKQKFENLTGKTGTYAGTGDNAGKEILKAWIKSGCNSSEDGPGYGELFSPNYTYSNEVTVTNTTDTHFFDSTAEDGVTYRYRVRANNDKGHSDFCSEACGWKTECDLTEDKCPSELTASDGADGTGIFLEWLGGGGKFDTFRIFRACTCGDGDADDQWAKVGETINTAWVDETVECNKVYKYYIEKVCGTKTCSSNIDTGYWLCEGYCPTELVATDCEEDGVHVTWDPGTGYGVFTVFRQEGDAISILGITEDAEYLDESAVCGLSYDYWVEKVVCGNPCQTNHDSGSKFCGDFCPSGLVATDDDSDGVTLTWTPGDGTGTFEVLRKLKGGSSYTTIKTLTAGAASTYFDDSAECDKVYTYQIRKTGTCGAPCTTNEEDGGRKCCEYCPSGLQIENGPDCVTLTWDGGCALPPEGMFKIQRKLGANGTWSNLGTTLETTYCDDTGDCDVQYIYRVKKWSNQGDCFTGEATGTKTCCEYCPTDLQIENGPDCVTLTWDGGCALPPEGFFKIQRAPVGTLDWVVLGMTTETTYCDSTGECNVEYTYRVKKWSNQGDCFTNNANGKLICCEFCPTGLVATDGTYNCGVLLTWDPGCGDGTFDVYRKLKGGTSGFKKVGWTTTNSYVDGTGACNYHYIYKIKKYNDAGEECWTNEDEGWWKSN